VQNSRVRISFHRHFRIKLLAALLQIASAPLSAPIITAVDHQNLVALCQIAGNYWTISGTSYKLPCKTIISGSLLKRRNQNAANRGTWGSVLARNTTRPTFLGCYSQSQTGHPLVDWARKNVNWAKTLYRTLKSVERTAQQRWYAIRVPLIYRPAAVVCDTVLCVEARYVEGLRPGGVGLSSSYHATAWLS
jgi:hypothetical protein